MIRRSWTPRKLARHLSYTDYRAAISLRIRWEDLPGRLSEHFDNPFGWIPFHLPAAGWPEDLAELFHQATEGWKYVHLKPKARFVVVRFRAFDWAYKGVSPRAGLPSVARLIDALQARDICVVVCDVPRRERKSVRVT